MAVTLPILGLSVPLQLLRSSHRHSPTSCVSNLTALPSICRVRTSGSTGISTSQALARAEIPSNAGLQSSKLVSVQNAKSVEHCSAEEPFLLNPVLWSASALAIAASLLSAGASLADEGVVPAIDGSDAGISTTVSVLFVVATVGLVVLTGGVIYLGLSEFLEKRSLQEEQKKVVEEKPKKPNTKQAVKAAARAGGPKGFGSSRRAKGDAEDIGGSD